jgi:hypothetical protein
MALIHTGAVEARSIPGQIRRENRAHRLNIQNFCGELQPIMQKFSNEWRNNLLKTAKKSA